MRVGLNPHEPSFNPHSPTPHKVVILGTTSSSTSALNAANSPSSSSDILSSDILSSELVGNPSWFSPSLPSYEGLPSNRELHFIANKSNTQEYLSAIFCCLLEPCALYFRGELGLRYWITSAILLIPRDIGIIEMTGLDLVI